MTCQLSPPEVQLQAGTLTARLQAHRASAAIMLQRILHKMFLSGGHLESKVTPSAFAPDGRCWDLPPPCSRCQSRSPPSRNALCARTRRKSKALQECEVRFDNIFRKSKTCAMHDESSVGTRRASRCSLPPNQIAKCARVTQSPTERERECTGNSVRRGVSISDSGT